MPEFAAPAIDGRYWDPWRVPWASALKAPGDFRLHWWQRLWKRCSSRVNLPHSERPQNLYKRQRLACTTSTLNYLESCRNIWSPQQGLTSTRYPTRPELLFCYPNPTRTTFKKFRVSGFSQQAVSQQAASNLLTIILKFCCFLVALTRNPLFNWFMMRYTLQAE